MLDHAAGEPITARGARDVVLLADAPALTITWSRYAAGEEGPGLHIHREHIDAFYVLEGELTFAVGADGDTLRAGPGTFVAVPAGVAHGFANASGAEVRWLNFHAPDAGFAEYMRGARDGVAVEWDSFTGADGSGPASGVAVDAPLPGLAVTALDAAAAPPPAPGEQRYPLDGGRVLSIRPG